MRLATVWVKSVDVWGFKVRKAVVTENGHDSYELQVADSATLPYWNVGDFKNLVIDDGIVVAASLNLDEPPEYYVPDRECPPRLSAELKLLGVQVT